MQIKHQDGNLHDAKWTDAAKYFIPSNAMKARAFRSHSLHAPSFKKRARTGTLQQTDLGLLLPCEWGGGGERGNKRARIKRKGSWLSIRPEDLHVFGQSSSSCRYAGCAYEVHLCIFMRYQWPSNELQAGAPNHVQRLRGVILNAHLPQDLGNFEQHCFVSIPLSFENNYNYLFKKIWILNNEIIFCFTSCYNSLKCTTLHLSFYALLLDHMKI